jgi:hypothetical protein
MVVKNLTTGPKLGFDQAFSSNKQAKMTNKV